MPGKKEGFKSFKSAVVATDGALTWWVMGLIAATLLALGARWSGFLSSIVILAGIGLLPLSSWRAYQSLKPCLYRTLRKIRHGQEQIMICVGGLIGICGLTLLCGLVFGWGWVFLSAVVLVPSPAIFWVFWEGANRSILELIDQYGYRRTAERVGAGKFPKMIDQVEQFPFTKSDDSRTLVLKTCTQMRDTQDRIVSARRDRLIPSFCSSAEDASHIALVALCEFLDQFRLAERHMLEPRMWNGWLDLKHGQLNDLYTRLQDADKALTRMLSFAVLKETPEDQSTRALEKARISFESMVESSTILTTDEFGSTWSPEDEAFQSNDG